MKTPMQELIELFEDRLSSLKEVRATAFDEMKRALDIQIEELEICILSAEYMLEKEKALLIKTHGNKKVYNKKKYPTILTGEEWYNKTFNTKDDTSKGIN